MIQDDTGECDVDADDAMRMILGYDEMRMLADAVMKMLLFEFACVEDNYAWYVRCETLLRMLCVGHSMVSVHDAACRMLGRERDLSGSGTRSDVQRGRAPGWLA